MEIEHLNKTQIILLTLLVSFVTSIATGITTVTLMDQAPPGTTTTIRNVVERTVEKVVQAGTPKETVKTVVVREEDAIADAIDSQAKALVRIYAATITADAPLATDQAAGAVVAVGPQLIALGFVLSDDGTIVTDSLSVSEETTYMVKVSDGTTFDVKATFQDEEKRVAFLQPTKPLENKLSTVAMGDSDSARLGGMAIVIAGKDQTTVNVGVFSGFDSAKKTITKDDKDTEITYRSGIILSTPVSTGAIVLSGNGTVVGMGLSPDSKSLAVPSNIIKELTASIPAPKTE